MLFNGSMLVAIVRNLYKKRLEIAFYFYCFLLTYAIIFGWMWICFRLW